MIMEPNESFTNESLAIASVPCQKWGQLFDENTALTNGTVFPDLNKPFFVTCPATDSPLTQGKRSAAVDPQQMEREQLMDKINKVSFFVNDLTLYLDTHCEDREALHVLTDKVRERAELMHEFAEKFYPLTCDCIAKCSRAGQENLWALGPAPWEGACV